MTGIPPNDEIVTVYQLSQEDHDLLRRWRHFRAFGDQSKRFIKINQHTKKLAQNLMEMCPRSPELRAALQHLEECRLHANMAIMKNEEE
jgi:hypothetical protein